MSDLVTKKIELGTSREWTPQELEAFDNRLSLQARDAFTENFTPDQFSRLPMKQVLDLASRFEYLNEGFSAEEITSIVQEELAHYQLLRLQVAREKVASKNPQLLDAFDEVLAKFGGENLLFAISGDDGAVTALKTELQNSGYEQQFLEALVALTTVEDDAFTDLHLEALRQIEVSAKTSDVSTEYIVNFHKDDIIRELESILTTLITTYSGDTSAQIRENIEQLLKKIRAGEKLSAVDKSFVLIYMTKPIHVVSKEPTANQQEAVLV